MAALGRFVYLQPFRKYILFVQPSLFGGGQEPAQEQPQGMLSLLQSPSDHIPLCRGTAGYCDKLDQHRSRQLPTLQQRFWLCLYALVHIQAHRNN